MGYNFWLCELITMSVTKGGQKPRNGLEKAIKTLGLDEDTVEDKVFLRFPG